MQEHILLVSWIDNSGDDITFVIILMSLFVDMLFYNLNELLLFLKKNAFNVHNGELIIWTNTQFSHFLLPESIQDRPFHCSQCPSTFSRKPYLDIHMRVSFSFPSYLRLFDYSFFHVFQIHTGEKPCEIRNFTNIIILMGSK